MKSKLQPLPPSSAAGGSLNVHCCECPTHEVWSEAVKNGWTYDPNGKPFEAYFCPDCTAHHCTQCGTYMNPVDRMVGPVCLKCCKANHKAVAGD